MNAEQMREVAEQIGNLGDDLAYIEACRKLDLPKRAYDIAAAIRAIQITPEPVRVKPLVWGQFREGGCVGRPKEFQYFVTQQHNGRFFCHFDESSHDHLADAQAHCDQHYQRAAIDLTPPPVDASPAPDPVSKTPALDAMAMQRAWYTAGIRAAALRYRAGSGPDSWDYFALAEAAILDLLTFERVDPPLPSPAAALAEALQRPEVKALVEALTLAANRLQRLAVEFVPGSHNFITVGEWADEALAALKGVK